MRFPTPARASLAVASATLAVGLLAPASTASADDGPVPLDIVAIKATPADGSTLTTSVKGIDFVTTITVDWAALGTNAAFFGDLYRGPTLLQRDILLGAAAKDGGSSTGVIDNKGWAAFQNRWGRGTFQLRNVRIEWYAHPDQTNHVDTAYTGGSFTIRSGVSASARVRKVAGSTKKKRVTVRLSAYGTDGRYHGLKTRVTLQRKVGSRWKYVTVVGTNAKGVGTKTVRYAKKARYRVVLKATSTTAGKVVYAGRA